MSSKGRVCAAWGCNNRETSHVKHEDGNLVRFHRFPTNRDVALKWRQNLRNASLDKLPMESLARLKVCSLHFKAHHYTCPERRHFSSTRLNWNAVPSIINCANPPSSPTSKRRPPMDRSSPLSRPSRQEQKEKSPHLSDSLDEERPTDNIPSTSSFATSATQTSSHTRHAKTSPRLLRQLHRLRCRVDYWRKRSRAIEQRLQSIEGTVVPTNCPPKAKKFLAMQLKSIGKNKNGLRWNSHDIELGLSIYHSGPKAYRFLREELKLALPSRRSLKKRTFFLMRSTGPCPTIMSSLANKVKSLHDNEKFATLSIDGMHLTPSVRYEEHVDRFVGFEDISGCDDNNSKVADEGVVVMLRGISTNWKQPIAHYFVNRSVKQHRFHNIIMDCLRAAHESGVTVLALVCDQESTQWALIQRMVSIETPYFHHPSTDEKVYVIIDVPHCLKNIRNALINYNISFGDNKTARWEHLLNFYHSESNRQLKLAPRLNESHFSLKLGQRMRVSTAAQVLSHTVSQSMKTLVHFDRLSTSHLDTADFCSKVNDIFDVCNSARTNNVGFKKAVGDNNFQETMSFLKDSMTFMRTLKFLPNDPTKKTKQKMPFQEGWLLSLASFCEMLPFLINECGFKFVRLRQFTQDHVENCFSKIRGVNGFNDHPEVRAFRGGLRNVCVNSILRPLSNTRNCEDDDGEQLLNLDSIQKNSEKVETACVTQTESQPSVSSEPPKPPEENSNPELSIVEEEILHYVGGAVLRHTASCGDCSNIICRPRSEERIFTYLKSFPHVTEGLCYISEECLETFREMESIFRKRIDEIYTSGNLCSTLFSVMSHLSLPACEKHLDSVNSRFKRYFIRLRLHAWAKRVTQNMKTATKNATKKKVKKFN